jgi:hypothetical protein
MHEWLSVWTSPRKVIARIVVTHPNRWIFIFSTIYGLLSLLNFFVMLKYVSYGRLLLLILIAPIYGYIAISIWSFLIHWIAKWFGGRASFLFVRAAFSWSCAPLICNILIWALLLLAFPSVFFVSSEAPLLLQPRESLVFFALLFGKLVFAIWSLVIYVQMLAEVSHFSILKSLGTIALSFAILLFTLNLLLLI